MNSNRRLPRVALTLMIMFALAAISSACDDGGGQTCADDNECPLGQRCVLGTCEEAPPTGCEEDEDCPPGESCVVGTCSGSLEDGVIPDGGDMVSQNCPSGVAPVAGELKFNEIHAAPDSGADDVNCDGVTSADDEFIEIVNDSDKTLDLGGIQLLEDGEARHTFGGCLQPGRGLVLYNKSLSPDCGVSELGETLAFSSRDSFALNNSGGDNLVLEGGGTTLDEVSVPSLSSRSSWTRAPDFTGEFTEHATILGVDARFSMGRCVGGGPLERGCMLPGLETCGNETCEPPETAENCPSDCAIDCPTGTPPAAGELKLNEIHAAPDSGADDVNCDGINSQDDEFIEIVNDTDRELDITGVELLENGSAKHTFAGCLAAGRGIVVYNKQLQPMCTSAELGETLAFPADDSFTLTNGGGEVIALQLDTTVLDEVTTPDLGSRDSYTRAPDFSGDFTMHSSIPNVDARFSVGRCVGGGPLERGCALPMGAMCDDGTCDPGEDANSCPADCTGVCGDGVCDMTEDETSCAMDCAPVCGDGVCAATENPTDCPDDCMETCDPPGVDDLVLNEVLYDPSSVASAMPFQQTGDANCDGSTSSTQDEFVEIVNVSAAAVNLNGVQVVKDGGQVAEFTSDECLAPDQALLVFGGGAASCAEFSDSVTLVDGLQLSNTGATVEIQDANGTAFTLGTLTYADGDATDTSLVRSPELTGSTFVPFDTVITDGTLQSPGTCADGSAFSTGCN